MANKGQTQSVKALAKQVVRSRKAMARLERTKCSMTAVNLHLTTAIASMATASSLKMSAGMMTEMNKLMNVPEMAKTMEEMRAEMAKAEIMDPRSNGGGVRGVRRRSGRGRRDAEGIRRAGARQVCVHGQRVRGGAGAAGRGARGRGRGAGGGPADGAAGGAVQVNLAHAVMTTARPPVPTLVPAPYSRFGPTRTPSDCRCQAGRRRAENRRGAPALPAGPAARAALRHSPRACVLQARAPRGGGGLVCSCGAAQGALRKKGA
ncbi:unnamed protein product, partial [Prorocentrum cordatum]